MPECVNSTTVIFRSAAVKSYRTNDISLFYIHGPVGFYSGCASSRSTSDNDPRRTLRRKYQSYIYYVYIILSQTQGGVCPGENSTTGGWSFVQARGSKPSCDGSDLLVIPKRAHRRAHSLPVQLSRPAALVQRRRRIQQRLCRRIRRRFRRRSGRRQPRS